MVVLVGSKIAAFASNVERDVTEIRNATNIDKIRILLIPNPCSMFHKVLLLIMFCVFLGKILLWNLSFHE